MKTNTQNLAGFLEALRKSKKLSRDEFCCDIMSKRQYQRYIKGETDISNENLAKFADKLGASILLLQTSFQEFSDKELRYLKTLLKLANGMQYDEAYKKLAEYRNYIFSTNYYNSLYKYIETNILSALKKINIDDAISIFSKLGHLDMIDSSKSFTFVEIASISYIAKLESHRGKREILDKLYLVLTKKENVTFFGRYEAEWMASVYSNIANTYGLIDDFEKVIELSNIGIQVCKDNQLLNSLPHHFFNLALAYKFTDRLDEGLKNAGLALMAVKLEFSDTKFNSYKNSIEKHFGIKAEDLRCL